MHWHLMAVSRLCTRDSTATFSIHSCMHYPCYSYHFKKYLQTYPNFIYDSHRFSRYTILYDMYVAALQLNAAPLLAECETPKRCSSYRQRGYIYILCMYIYICVWFISTCFQSIIWVTCWRRRVFSSLRAKAWTGRNAGAFGCWVGRTSGRELPTCCDASWKGLESIVSMSQLLRIFISYKVIIGNLR